MNDGQFNHHYNDFYNDINNEQNNEPNIGPTQQMVDEENLHPIDNVANNEKEKEAVEPETRTTRVQRFSFSASDIAGTSEVRPNLTPFDFDNVRTWVIPGAQSYSFADGTHLKERFGGTMFVATAQDGNKQVYPIAFGKDVVAIMDKATRSYTELKYNRHLEEICNLYQNAFNYVIEAGPHKWSRIHYPERKYRVMTTNIAECINSCLKFPRQLPMLTLAEFIRNMLQRWFHDRHCTA
ncbi:hypothetical protein Ddye_013202 [Dipteronia dyeriana]|uniref:Uncharacterized protein n=1 Tax=Dipteronia dyeriana TaxID=168575 RepID=A0AAD9X602_9ROSI|nr:hypothetical protein Ddye_013202 [Dipteronia dyeriana]